MKLSSEYAIIIKSRTRLESILERCSTRSMARFQIESQGGNFDEYEAEHEIYQEVLSEVQKRLSELIRSKLIERAFLPSYLFADDVPLVIVIGQDGLVANTAKYVGNIPILAINPDPDRYDGVLLPFDHKNFIEGTDRVLSGKYASRIVPLAEARLSDGQRLLAFNDLFIGAASHVSARYRITFEKESEEQSSSGIIVSTKAGSTGWLSSIFNMSEGLYRFIDGINVRKNHGHGSGPYFMDEELFFAVREPFLSKRTRIGLIGGPIKGKKQLRIESYMPSGGVIFSDGIESDFMHFPAGKIARIGIAPEKVKLVLF